MPVLHVPNALRNLCDGRARFELEGATLREVFRGLEQECPGLASRIVAGDGLRPDIAVAIDGSILEGGELSHAVEADTEIYLVPPIGGGSRAGSEGR